MIGMGRTNAIEKQDAILAFIKSEVMLRGYPPSVREIGEAVGVMSTSTVHGHLSQLEKRGLIRRNKTKPRAIEVTDENHQHMGAFPIIPLIGKVTAGIPITAVEDIEGYIPLLTPMQDADTVFALRVVGDSMINAGIFSGDIVYVKRQVTAVNGDVIVAMTEDGEATVKRYFREKDRIRLQPENDSMEPLYYRNISVIGKVIGLWRLL